MSAISVSIVVATFNRPLLVQSVVKQILAQDVQDFEFWLIDQSDEAEAKSNKLFIEELNDARVKYLFVSQRGLPNARNEGLARCQAEIVVFLDDDVYITSPDFLRAHIVAYDDPTIGAVVGRHIERSIVSNTKGTKCEVSLGGRTLFNLFGSEQAFVKSCKGSNMSFRMQAVREVGGFDRKTNLLEETDYSTRVRRRGWKILFQPTAEVVHLSTPSGGVRSESALATEKVRFRSTAYYVMKHRGAAGALPFISTFFLIAVSRAWRFRTFATVPILMRTMFEGLADARRGANEELPVLEGSS